MENRTTRNEKGDVLVMNANPINLFNLTEVKWQKHS
jgi:hypothetical protein